MFLTKTKKYKNEMDKHLNKFMLGKTSKLLMHSNLKTFKS